jgi:hypothetical protein
MFSPCFPTFAVISRCFRFKPYAEPDLQRLSRACCLLLVALSSVLLRSQTLHSSARSINFEPTDPTQTANTMSVDVQVSVFVIMACLTLPLIIVLKPVAMFRSLFSLIKNCWGQAHKSQKHTNERVLNLNSFDMEHIPSPAGPQFMSDSDSDKIKTINAALSLNNFDPQMRERIGSSSLSTARVELYSYFDRPQLIRPVQPPSMGSRGLDFSSIVSDMTRTNKVTDNLAEQIQVSTSVQVNSVNSVASSLPIKASNSLSSRAAASGAASPTGRSAHSSKSQPSKESRTRELSELDPWMSASTVKDRDRVFETGPAQRNAPIVSDIVQQPVASSLPIKASNSLSSRAAASGAASPTGRSAHSSKSQPSKEREPF